MKRPLRGPFASVLLSALMAGLCGCPVALATPAAATAATAAHLAGTPAPTAPAALLAFAARIGVSCDNVQGRLSCVGGRPEVGDYYDIDLHPGCGADGWFAQVVASEGAKLRDRIAPIDQQTIATLSRDQLLCIEAVGRSGGRASYYYVQEVPARAIPGCIAGACGGSGDQPAQPVRESSAHCVISSNEKPANACASGWIRAETLKRIPATHP